MIKRKALKLESGFTLTEALVVLAIFIIVIVAVFSAYNFSREGYLEGENLAELTQNGRVVLERLTREIRQARFIVPPFPEDEAIATSTILFQDGHVEESYTTGTPSSVGTTTITLAPDSSTTTDFYKDVYLEIISGWGNDGNKIRKIISYDGPNQVATLNKAWLDPKPSATSTYKIDSYYYYVHYFASSTDSGSKEIYREVIVYYFPSDPNTYMPWDATSTTETLVSKKLEEPELTGEFVKDLKFWGDRVINAELILKKGKDEVKLKTKIFGRNL